MATGKVAAFDADVSRSIGRTEALRDFRFWDSEPFRLALHGDYLAKVVERILVVKRICGILLKSEGRKWLIHFLS